MECRDLRERAGAGDLDDVWRDCGEHEPAEIERGAARLSTVPRAADGLGSPLLWRGYVARHKPWCRIVHIDPAPERLSRLQGRLAGEQ